MNRELTKQEKDWIKKGLGILEKWKSEPERFEGYKEAYQFLKKLNTEKVTESLGKLRVIDKCDCKHSGCHTVKFSGYNVENTIAYPLPPLKDDRLMILFFDTRTKLPVELEII